MDKKLELIKSIEDTFNNELLEYMTHEDDLSMVIISDGETGAGTGAFKGSIASLVYVLVSEPELLETLNTACQLSKDFLASKDKEEE